MKKPATLLVQQKELTLIAGAFIALVVLIGSLLFLEIKPAAGGEKENGENIHAQATSANSSLILIRKGEHNLVRPLILADIDAESPEYLSLKGRLSQTITSFKQKGIITNASVYLKRLSDGSWMNLNGNETYLPGSLMKVAIMLYYLKQEELHPGTLAQEFFCRKPAQEFPKQEFEGETIIPGRSYKVSALIRSMIIESDNLATNTLCQHLDGAAFHQMFVDLSMPPDDINDLEYVISPREYSKFLRVLYNATYVGEEMSEFALSLMIQSKFKDGLVKPIPAGIMIAHKFGERGKNSVMDFSESGIIYDKKEPYLLTIMTRGSDMKEQSKVISELSGEVFHSLTKE